MQYSKNLANLPPTGGGSTTIPDPLTVNDLIVNNSIVNNGTTQLTGATTVIGDITSFANITSFGNIGGNNILASGDITGNNNFGLGGDADISGSLSVFSNATIRNNLTITNGTTSLRALNVNRTATFSSNVTISGAGVTTINNATDINASLTVSGTLNKYGLNRFEEGITTFFDSVYIDGSHRLFISNVPVENPRISSLAAGTIALTYTNQFTTYMLTGGTTANFTTVGLGGTTGIWYVKNARTGTGNDITINHSGTAITGVTSILHGRSANDNTATQTLYWNGTDLTMY